MRGDFFRYTRQEAREKLGLTDERPLLLSYWGSLGAEVMNRKMSEFIARECYDGAPFHHIHGARVRGCDLRGGAALVVAALGAEGTSRISGLKYIRRGYDGLDTALRALGAEITTIL